MALPNTSYTQLSAITQKYFVPKLVDNIFDSNSLLQRWRKKTVKYAGGTKIVVPVLYATTSAAGWYSGADTLNVTDNDQNTAAEFDLKQAYGNITITRLDELKNSGPQAVVNLVKAKVQTAEKTLADQLGTGIFNAGTTTNAIIGLRLAVQGTGYTYGGISKTTYSWWRGNVDSSTTVLSLKAMQGMQGDCQINNDQPSVWITTQDVYDDYYGLLQPQQRFVDSKTASGGFTNLLFNGKPIIVDSHCPSGHLFALNEDYLDLYVHTDENFRFESFIKPTNQNVSTAKIYWAGALTSSNCRMNGMFTSIA